MIMKTLKKYSNYFGLVLALCVLAISGCSCSAPKPVPTPDPLAGFHAASKNPEQLIIDDYQSYIKTLSPDEQKYATVDYFYEDGAGRHAVEIMITLNHTNWRHILIYDKNDKRIKTITYISGHSAS